MVKNHTRDFNLKMKIEREIETVKKNNISVLFEKKYQKPLVKNLTHITSDTGITRHYTPAAQEWHNSVYSYNPNYIKTLPVADANLMKILKSYFNLEINHKTLKTKRIPTRLKRLTSKKIYIGKGDIKHTSTKTIITFYVYNTHKMYLSRAVALTKKVLFYPKDRLFTNKNTLNVVSNNRPLKLKEYLALPQHFEKYPDYFEPYIDINNLYLSNLEIQRNILIKLVSLDLMSEEDKNAILIDLYKKVSFFNYVDFDTHMENTKQDYLSNLKKIRYYLGFNKMKFSKPFISKLISLVQGLYNKKVEFNIVNLKKMHLNTDIYTQVVALKLKNRHNSLYRVLKASLRKVKLPEIFRTMEKYYYLNQDELLVNLIRNDNISSMFGSNNSKDALDGLLLNLFPSVKDKINHVEKSSPNKGNISLKEYILKSLKHLKMRGIKVEAKGRISRRFTASRSVFKMKWIGGLKNVDSSFKGISAIMLRGHVKSNVQYSFLSSKNRNGAYGVKGWISSK